MDPDYETFDLLVEKHSAGYRVRVLSSPAGNATADLRDPIPEDRLRSFLFSVGQPRRMARRAGAQIDLETKGFGSDLLSFLLPEQIRTCFERSLQKSTDRKRGLRIQIRLSDVPELCDLPWEFLYDDEYGFLALSNQTPVVRFLDTRQPAMPLSIQHPLRVLVLISGPRDLGRLDTDREWAKLYGAIGDLAAKGHIYVERLDAPRLALLNRRLREDFHILHFIGHGDFDENRGGGLYFEDEQGRSMPISAQRIATALKDYPSVRLVILNSCEGARSSRTDAFAGTAQALIRAGVPAVIAMQFEVTDDAAITFSSELYASIALGHSVDHSLSEARKAIYFDGNELEWATPVLYLRSPDSRIFELPSTAAMQEERTKHEAARAAAAAEAAQVAGLEGSQQENTPQIGQRMLARDREGYDQRDQVGQPTADRPEEGQAANLDTGATYGPRVGLTDGSRLVEEATERPKANPPRRRLALLSAVCAAAALTLAVQRLVTWPATHAPPSAQHVLISSSQVPVPAPLVKPAAAEQPSQTELRVPSSSQEAPPSARQQATTSLAPSSPQLPGATTAPAEASPIAPPPPLQTPDSLPERRPEYSKFTVYIHYRSAVAGSKEFLDRASSYIAAAGFTVAISTDESKKGANDVAGEPYVMYFVGGIEPSRAADVESAAQSIADFLNRPGQFHFVLKRSNLSNAYRLGVWF